MEIKGQRESASGDLNAGIARVARARSSAERRIKTNEALGNEKPSCHGESGNEDHGGEDPIRTAPTKGP
jgi:hypothetical protein